MAKKSFERGSEWRRWDLHIHSPLSLLNNQYPKTDDGQPDWETFLTKLDSQDLSVVGITDYFTIEGYKKLRKFKEEGHLPKIHTILPNIEFRLSTIVEEKRLNFHVMFSDEVPVEDIEEHFLHDLNFYLEGTPQAPDERRKLKLSNLEELGAQLMNEHEPFRELGTPVEVGAMHAVVDHEEITERLTGDKRFKGKFLQVLAADDWDKISWDGQAHVVRKALLQKSDMVFSSNRKQREWCLGRPPYMEGQENFLEEFHSLKPCIHGCDAHRLEDIGRPCGLRGDSAHNCDDEENDCDLRFCWIKADPTFEGLKQLLYEPEDRVAIQSTNPSPVISNLSLQEVSVGGAVVNEELSVADTNIDLNPALVAVVGGKGTGKTALVDLLAHCYMDRETAEDPNSFVRRVSEYRPPLTIKLGFRDGHKFEKAFGDQQFFDAAQIVYIAQGELERYIGVKSDLHQRIQDLIFESDEIRDSILSFEFEEASELTETLAQKLSSQNQVIEELEESTSEKVLNEVERKRTEINNDLKDIEKRIKELAKVQTEVARKKAEERQERVGKLKERQENLKSLKEVLEEIREFLDGRIEEFNKLIAAATGLMRELEIEGKLPQLSYAADERITATLEIVSKESRETIKAIDKEQKEQAKMDLGVKNHAKLLEKRGDFQGALKSVETSAKGLEEKKKELEKARTERKTGLKALLDSIITQKTKYEEIIGAFAEKKDEILADIDFVAEIRFDADGFLEKAEAVLDNRKVDVKGNEDSPSVFREFMELSRQIAKGEASKIDELVEEIEMRSTDLKSKKKASPISVADFYDLLYQNYMDVVPVVKYKKTNLEKLSLGQKATVLIKIYLAHGDKPIVIDSHDDHLDNEFIMDELVRAIRRAKYNRQIMLVSNNGNVVINSDAEQIIVAQREGEELSYVAGSIENTEIRERALLVLEGGRDAFKKRQKKYRMV